MIISRNKTYLRDYQQDVADEVIDSYGSGKHFVLGACPNSGKTRTTIDIIISLVESGKAKRVLVLTHGTNVIKHNFMGDCEEFLLKESYSDDPTDNSAIHVALPQNHNKIGNNYDVVVVDEAHQFYHAETVQGILERNNPSLVLLLTGTPSKFIAEGDKYNMRIIAMNEISSEYFHNVSFKLIKSDYNFGLENYTHDFEINSDTKILMDNTANTINNVVYGIVEHIANRDGVYLGDGFNAWDEAKTFFNKDRFGKTLFVCKRIGQARQVAEILNKNGITAYSSESKGDKDSELIQAFKENKIQVLCVVNRAKEGFSDPSMVNLVDLSMTHNINTIKQTYCRVVRKLDGFDNNKLYIKVTPDVEGMPEYTMAIVSAALMLSHHRYLSTYNGKNFKGLIVPKIGVSEEEYGQISFSAPEYNNSTEMAYLTEDNVWIDANGREVEVNDQGQPLNIDGEPMKTSDTQTFDISTSDFTDEYNSHSKKYLDNGLKNEIDSSFFTEVAEQISEGNTIYSTTSMSQARDTLVGNVSMSNKEAFDICVNNELKSASQYWSFRKQNKQINLPSSPWERVKKAQPQYFAEVRDKLGVVDNTMLNKEVFDICVDNELKSSPQYLNFREQNKQINLPSVPWKRLKKTKLQYFSEVRSEIGVVNLSNKEVFDICVDNELRSSTQYKGFRKQNKQINLPSAPWKTVKKTGAQYFSEVRDELKKKCK